MDNYFKKYIKYKQKYQNLKQRIKDKKNIIWPKYIIFSGETYYPNGGWEDFFDTAETLDEAKKSYENGLHSNGWAHIVDMKNKKIILSSQIF